MEKTERDRDRDRQTDRDRDTERDSASANNGRESQGKYCQMCEALRSFLFEVLRVKKE